MVSFIKAESSRWTATLIRRAKIDQNQDEERSAMRHAKPTGEASVMGRRIT